MAAPTDDSVGAAIASLISELESTSLLTTG